MGKKNGMHPRKKLRKALKERNARRNAMAETITKSNHPTGYKVPGSMQKK